MTRLTIIFHNINDEDERIEVLDNPQNPANIFVVHERFQLILDRPRNALLNAIEEIENDINDIILNERRVHGMRMGWYE